MVLTGAPARAAVGSGGSAPRLAPVVGAWAVHDGRLGKVIGVHSDGARVEIVYADDGGRIAWLEPGLEPANVAAAGPAQVAEGEAMLDPAWLD